MNNIKMIYFDRIIFVMELMLIKRPSQKSGIFITIGIFYVKALNFNQMVANRCHDLQIMSMNLSDIATLNIKSADYCCIISGIIKTGAVNLIHNTNLTKKSGI